MARKIIQKQCSTLSMTAALADKEGLFDQLREGAVFIYPTDTIYGMGCDALISSAVRRVRELKAREQKPFSVIAPSKEWILENCVVEHVSLLDLLPGPYTLVLKLKVSSRISREVSSTGTIGVRIPKHPIASFVEAYGRPIVTTSVNKTGEPNAVSKEEFKQFAVDVLIYEGKKEGVASTIVDTVAKKTIVRSIRRRE